MKNDIFTKDKTKSISKLMRRRRRRAYTNILQYMPGARTRRRAYFILIEKKFYSRGIFLPLKNKTNSYNNSVRY